MRTLLYIFILLIVTSCSFSRSYPEALDEAQRLMQSAPSAALSKLNAVDVSEFQDSATMARWALLYSEALAVNRLSAPTDTIVNIAIDYYGRHRLTDEFQKATRLKSLIQPTDSTDELATALYLQKEKEFMLYKERTKRERLLIAGLLFLLIAIGTILWMRRGIKMQALKNDALMAEACGLKTQIEATRSDMNRLESKLHSLLDNRFSLIDSLCQTYYEFQGTKTERKAIIDKVKSAIESVRSDSFPEMEQAVNDCRDNILVKVRSVWPDIRTDDYLLLVYLASGLSTRTISLLLDQTVEVVYKRKSRLKDRLKKHIQPACREIMTIF